MPFASSPSEHHRDHREAAGAECESGREAVFQVIEPDVAARSRDSRMRRAELLKSLAQLTPTVATVPIKATHAGSRGFDHSGMTM